MKKIKTKFFFLIGALGLSVLNFLIEHIVPKDEDISINLSNIHNKRKHVTKKSYIYSWPPCQKNTSVSNVTDISNYPQNIREFLYYQHCRHFPLLLDIPNKCGGPEYSEEVFLLLVIKSSPGNFNRREVLRKTWAKERIYNDVWIRRIFISGTAGVGFEKERLNKLLTLEQREFSDIIQWDFSDTFYNLTLKQILFLEWMKRNCPKAHFLFNGDDDVFAHTNNMVSYLQGLKHNDGSKHLFTGHVIQNAIPKRSQKSKYFIPVQMYKSKSYPPYCSGGGFLLSGFTAMAIYTMSGFIPIFPIDDVYMGMCLAKAGLGPSFHMGVKSFGIDIPPTKKNAYDPCYYKDILVVHGFLPAQIYIMWHGVRDPYLKCVQSHDTQSGLISLKLLFKFLTRKD